MIKQILRFLSPVLTILGLFTILLVLSSSDDGGCCNKEVILTRTDVDIYFFNNSSLPVRMNDLFTFQDMPPQSTYGFKDDHSFTPEGFFEFRVYRDGELLGAFSFKTTYAKCQKLPILVVWDGSNLKVAQ
jgi:hypothetical protein